jgi:GNAT superfamily N-acetyltransferase
MLDEARRGQGYGKQAMLAIEAVAKDLGIETIGLHVFAHNPAAMQLYKGLGYEPTSQNMVKHLSD